MAIESSNGYRYSGDYFQIPGRVLHVDGDASYLRKCLDLYEKFGIPVNGVYCNEKEMPQKIGSLLDHYRPDILVVLDMMHIQIKRTNFRYSMHIVIQRNL